MMVLAPCPVSSFFVTVPANGSLPHEAIDLPETQVAQFIAIKSHLLFHTTVPEHCPKWCPPHQECDVDSAVDGLGCFKPNCKCCAGLPSSSSLARDVVVCPRRPSWADGMVVLGRWLLRSGWRSLSLPEGDRHKQHDVLRMQSTRCRHCCGPVDCARRLINESALDVDVKGGDVRNVPRQALHGFGHVDRNVDHRP
ncbi:hypothetical protein HPB50_012549 [Hyalomma asiaticum]|uniref:Uncharacterized protein n=1 Tax=Hyalomma asiaticum TaxID=266040 RepID=A0ACB7S5U0_HYAAI|nr:hypothetical protein HPB50_012549 [Hyalomma asiaticum]